MQTAKNFFVANYGTGIILFLIGLAYFLFGEHAVSLISILISIPVIGGLLSLARGSGMFGNTLLIMFSAAGAFYLGGVLGVDPEALFLFSVVMGAASYLSLFSGEAQPAWLFILLPGWLIYYWHIYGFVDVLTVFLLASFVGAIIFQTPLRFLRREGNKLTVTDYFCEENVGVAQGGALFALVNAYALLYFL